MRIERILANNPGPFTGPGTNTWLLDDDAGNLVVIDPGPIDIRHQDAIVDRVGNRSVTGVLVTHTHPDHAPLANPLARDLDVPAIGYGPGPGFEPDVRLDEGSRLEVGATVLQVVHTPGHSDDHLCFRVDDVLFTGDHMIGGSSVMVERMGPYLRSLERLRGVGLRRLLPGHGDEMEDPDAVIDWYLAHRRRRHEQIYRAIADGAHTTMQIVQAVYQDVDPSLHPLAARSVEAHLVLLGEQGRIASGGGGLYAIPPHVT